MASSSQIVNSSVNSTKTLSKLRTLSLGGGVDGDAPSMSDGLSVAPVADGTSVAAAVTVNGRSGVITTEVLTAATHARQSIVVTNQYASADSIIVLTVLSYAGTALGNPVANVSARAAGEFTIDVANAGSAALDALATISYVILSTK